MRSRPRIPLEEIQAELLPDVTRRLGKPIRYSSDADRLAMERLRLELERQLVQKTHELRQAA